MKPSELMRIGHEIMPVQTFGNFFDLVAQDAEVSPDNPEQIIKGAYRVTAACGIGCMWLGVKKSLPIIMSRTELPAIFSPISEAIGYSIDKQFLPCPAPLEPFSEPNMEHSLMLAVVLMNDRLRWSINEQIIWLERNGQ